MRKVVIVVFLAMSLCSQAQEKLTLNEIIEIALENNYSILISRNEAEIARNNNSLGNAGFLPTADVLVNRDYGVEDTEQRFADGTNQNRQGAKSNTFSLGGDINWTIFNGGQMFFNYDRLAALQLIDEVELQFAVESLIYNIQLAFYQAALERERLALFQSNIEFSEVRLRISKDRYELGSSSKLEYLQAQVDYNSDKSAILSQLELLSAQKYQLVNLMGIKKNTLDFELEYDLEVSPQLDFESMIGAIQSQNAQLRAFKLNIDVAEYDNKILKGQRFPELDVYLGYNRTDLEAGAGFITQRNTQGIGYGLTVRWNVFNGFNLNRQIQNSKILIENSEYLLKQQELDIETNMRVTYLNYQNNLQLMSLEQENLEVARENYDIAQDRYKIGLSNPLELREAQVNLVNAEIRYQNAAFAAKRAEIELEFLSGSIVNNPN